MYNVIVCIEETVILLLSVKVSNQLAMRKKRISYQTVFKVDPQMQKKYSSGRKSDR